MAASCRLVALVAAFIGGLVPAAVVRALGVNWGTMATHPLPPRSVVQMLQDNGIRKVKLFDADAGPMGALAGSGVEVMVGVPNNMLGMMTDYDAAREWVHRNVSAYTFDGGVNIKYVAVGNEPFLKSLNGTFLTVTLPALQNIQRALDDAGLGDTVKATVPLNADVYNSPPDHQVPSAGRFRPDIADLMTPIVQFLNQSGAPLIVNIYPFLSLYGNSGFPLDYAFFDGTGSPVVDDASGITYTNVFDANFDTLVSALDAAGFGGLPVVVGEVGWPTDGDAHATAALARRFYAGLTRKLAANAGTPLRPNQYIEVYLFSLIDEDAKSVAPGNFERHWGIMRYDGQPKYIMDLSGGDTAALVAARDVRYLPRQWCVANPNAPGLQSSRVGDSVSYACAYADCTSLGYGSTCNGLDAVGNASYAFNMYFQVQNQAEGSCDFQGLAVQTAQDPSTGGCNFTIQIAPSAAGSRRSPLPIAALALVLLAVLVAPSD